MNSTLLAVLIVLVGSSLVMSASLQATGFRPGKAFHPSHSRAALSPSHHHHILDLEREKSKAKSPEAPAKASEKNLEEKQEQQVEALLQKTSSHMHELEENFKAVKDDLAALKETEEARIKHAAKPAAKAASKPAAKAPEAKKVKEAKVEAKLEEEDKAEEKQEASKDVVDDFAAADADLDNTASFLQYDDMNSGMVEDDDELLAPVPMAKRAPATGFVATQVPTQTDEFKTTFALSGNQAQGTYDVTTDGTPIVRETLVAGIEKFDNNTVVPDAEKDLVCVCKRKGAPKGHDRIRCKKHITPTPTPTATPLPVTGIRQCVNGTWKSDAGPDANINDVICIYYPQQLPLLQLDPTPTPGPDSPHTDPNSPNTPPTEPEYPPECYDERNEFVAEGVVEKRKYDVLLLQEGFQTCGC